MAIADTFNSFVQAVKDFWKDFDLKRLSEKIGGTSAEAIQAAMYFGIFFGIGFVLKKYFKFLFGALIVMVVMVKVMEYNQLITVNWTALQTLVGMGQTGDFNSLMNASISWIKQNILVFVASVIGFLIGYKLG